MTKGDLVCSMYAMQSNQIQQGTPLSIHNTRPSTHNTQHTTNDENMQMGAMNLQASDKSLRWPVACGQQPYFSDTINRVFTGYHGTKFGWVVEKIIIPFIFCIERTS